MSTNDPAAERSGSVSFRPRARLIRLLGEELISDEVMAVVELVKNGYDADARRVTVTLEGILDPAQGLIYIRDDGCGMDLHTVLHTWMEPATHYKRGRAGARIRTTLGRIQLGEKGVGRFAADKLGCELELITRSPAASDEIVVNVSWHHFDHDRYLDEVQTTWQVREPVEFAGEASGTLLRIRQLRAAWNQEMVTRLHNGLTRLVSPSAKTADFVVEVNCPEFPFANGQVINRLLETAPYQLSGTIDAHGTLNLKGTAGRQVDLRPHCQGYFLTEAESLRQPCCGPFDISLNLWDLEPLTGRGLGVDRSVRDAVKLSSGVSIYRDGFRVWPYGEKDDDWLELNQRRVNNPTLRVSNNQVIGFVEITQAENPELRDRTSREGLLDTAAFFDLKMLVLAALTELETERFSRRRRPDPPPVKEDIKDEVLENLARIRDISRGNGHGPGIGTALQELERLYRERIEQEMSRYNQVSRLAGIGMAAELLTDSFSREILGATSLLKILQRSIRTGSTSEIESLVEGLTERMEIINEQLDIMGPLYRPAPQDNEPVNLRGAVYDAVTILAGRLTDNLIHATLAGQDDLAVRVNRGHLIQVLLILIENALISLKEAAIARPQIHIEVTGEGGVGRILVADNGPGVPENVRKLIFLPYFSTRQAGRGLGLHVAKDILASYNSSLRLLDRGSHLAGAYFEVRFDGRRMVGQSSQNGAVT